MGYYCSSKQTRRLTSSGVDATRHNGQIVGLIDIHCHILPGIDDGPPDLAGSLEMARAAVRSAITTIVATPHLRADFPNVRVDELADRCGELRDAIKAEAIELNIVPGGEVSLSWALEATEEMLKLASYGQRGKDILIETPMVGGAMLPALLGQVASRGYRVVLAHPERLPDFREDPTQVERLVQQNVVLQVNANALVDNPRRSSAAKLARYLCDRGLVSAIASDAHRGLSWRAISSITDAWRVLSDRGGTDYAATLLRDAPAAILAGELIPSASLPVPAPRRSILRWRS